MSFGGANGFNVPVEIKKDTHPDLWRAIHEQLIPKYVRDPGADGHGIYLVFWFGGKGMKPPPTAKNSATPPNSKSACGRRSHRKKAIESRFALLIVHYHLEFNNDSETKMMVRKS